MPLVLTFQTGDIHSRPGHWSLFDYHHHEWFVEKSIFLIGTKSLSIFLAQNNQTKIRFIPKDTSEQEVRLCPINTLQIE